MQQYQEHINSHTMRQESCGVVRLGSAVTSWQAASPHPRYRLAQLPLCPTRRMGARSVSFYSVYKKLTELSANTFRLLFCWLVGAQLPLSRCVMKAVGA